MSSWGKSNADYKRAQKRTLRSQKTHRQRKKQTKLTTQARHQSNHRAPLKFIHKATLEVCSCLHILLSGDDQEGRNKGFGPCFVILKI